MPPLIRALVREARLADPSAFAATDPADEEQEKVVEEVVDPATVIDEKLLAAKPPPPMPPLVAAACAMYGKKVSPSTPPPMPPAVEAAVSSSQEAAVSSSVEPHELTARPAPRMPPAVAQMLELVRREREAQSSPPAAEVGRSSLALAYMSDLQAAAAASSDAWGGGFMALPSSVAATLAYNSSATPLAREALPQLESLAEAAREATAHAEVAAPPPVHLSTLDMPPMRDDWDGRRELEEIRGKLAKLLPSLTD